MATGPAAAEHRVAGQPFEARLTTLDATMVVVSLVIGIGIFRTPAVVARAAGTPWGFLVAWAVGGLVSALGALTFAEIGARFPRPGAYYGVVAECYHPALAFALNWAGQLMQGAGAAGVAFVGAEHLLPLLGAGGPESPGYPSLLRIAGLTLLGLLLGVNFLGVVPGARTQNVLSSLKIVLLAVLGAAALWAGNLSEGLPNGATLGPGPGGFASALVAVFYTFGGYQNTINLGGDVRHASRRIPRAILLGMAIVVVVYLGINLAYLSVLGFGRLAASPLVAAEAASACFGPAGRAIVSVAIVLSAAGFVNATILQVPRAYYAMAKDGGLPSFFLRVDPRTQAQVGALLFLGASMVIPAFFLGSFEKLLSYVMFTDALSLAVVASTVFVLRARDNAPGGLSRSLLPALFVLFLLAVAVRVLIVETSLAIAGLGVMATGAVLFAVMRRRRSGGPASAGPG